MTKEIILKISGMRCASCTQVIEKGLKKEKGVISASVNFTLGEASVEFNPDEIDKTRIKESIRKTGYTVREQELEEKNEIKKGSKILVWPYFNFARIHH